MKAESTHEHRMDRNAWLILIFAAVFLLLSLVQIAYRFTLPTDGWWVYTETLENLDWIYYSDLVGTPSGLQRGDTLVSVADLSTQGTATLDALRRPENWAIGKTVTMIVKRADQQLRLEVPVVHWTLPAIWRFNFADLGQFTSLLGALIFLAVGWFTFLRRPALPSARALLMFSTAIGASFLSGILPEGLSVQFDPLAFKATSFFSYVIFGAFLAPSLLVFALLFPRPKQALQRRPWLVILPYGLGLAILIYYGGGGEVPQIGWFATLGMFSLSIISMVHASLTQRDAISRAQFRWALSGLLLGLGLFMLNFPTALGWVTNPSLGYLLSIVANLGSPIIGIGFAVAILRYRLFDIDVIIRRTLIYTVLTVTLAVIYLIGILLLQTVIPPQSQLDTVLSTLASAALFSPLRRRIQTYIDRVFYRQKYDAERTLAAFSASARDEVDLEQLSNSLLAVVDSTMQPGSITLWLKDVKQ